LKVIGLNGAASREGNTAILMRRVFRELEDAGIETELLHVAGEEIRDCRVCRKCHERKDRRCSQGDDPVNGWLERIFAADGLVLGSPVYHATVTVGLKAFMDRCGTVSKANGNLLARKVGTAVVAARRAGGILTLDTLQRFFLTQQMIVPGSTSWNIGVGLERGDVNDDREGMEIMATLGRNMAWLVKKLAS
jgi:multimeric flavodoxin WrbA